MSTYFCRKCYSLFDDKVSLIGKCPVYRCYGHLVKIDEQFGPLVKAFNEFGLTTRFSCSGHVYLKRKNSKPSLMFDMSLMNFQLIPIIYECDLTYEIASDQNLFIINSKDFNYKKFYDLLDRILNEFKISKFVLYDGGKDTFTDIKDILYIVDKLYNILMLKLEFNPDSDKKILKCKELINIKIKEKFNKSNKLYINTIGYLIGDIIGCDMIDSNDEFIILKYLDKIKRR